MATDRTAAEPSLPDPQVYEALLAVLSADALQAHVHSAQNRQRQVRVSWCPRRNPTTDRDFSRRSDTREPT